MEATMKKYFMEDFIIEITCKNIEDPDCAFFVNIFKGTGTNPQKINKYFNKPGDSSTIVMNDLSELKDIFEYLTFYHEYMWNTVLDIHLTRELLDALKKFIDTIHSKYPVYRINIKRVSDYGKIELEIFKNSSYGVFVETGYDTTAYSRIDNIFTQAFKYVD